MIYNKNDYVNFLDETHVTYDSLIQTIKTFPSYAPPPRVSNCPSTEVSDVEKWGTYARFGSQYPPMVKMVDAFYDYVQTHDRIPNQYEFRDHYFKFANNNIVGFINALTSMGRNQNMLISALSDRCYRSYPSFVRDFEFALLLRDKVHMDVVYNKFLDTDMAIDLMYTGNSGINYGIHLFTDTSRAVDFREKKKYRHIESFDNVLEIDYVMSMNRYSVNGYKLYDMSDARGLIDKMKRFKSGFDNNKGRF